LQAQPLSLDEKCKKLEETIQRVETNTIGYTRKQTSKEWFDEECSKIKDERGKERRQRASHPKQHQRSQECLQTSPDEKGKTARRRGFNRD
jgi:hypothetical protein